MLDREEHAWSEEQIRGEDFSQKRDSQTLGFKTKAEQVNQEFRVGKIEKQGERRAYMSSV